LWNNFVDEGSVNITLPNEVVLGLHNLIEVKISRMSADFQGGHLRFRGKAVMPQLFNATADFAGGNYIEVTSDGIELRGVISLAEVSPTPGTWALREVSVAIDTVADTVEASALLQTPLGVDVGATLGFREGEFNTVEIFVEDLNKPIVAPWPLFLQDIGGGIAHFAESDPLPWEFFGNVRLTGGPQLPEFTLPNWAGGATIGGIAIAELDLSGHVDQTHLGGGGLLKFAEGGLGQIQLNVPGDGPDRHVLEGAQLNWSQKFLEANGNFDLLNGVLNGEAHLRADSRMNFLMSGRANISLPQISGVFRGIRLDLDTGPTTSWHSGRKFPSPVGSAGRYYSVIEWDWTERSPGWVGTTSRKSYRTAQPVEKARFNPRPLASWCRAAYPRSCCRRPGHPPRTKRSYC
jgi:hypothetical protein